MTVVMMVVMMMVMVMVVMAGLQEQDELWGRVFQRMTGGACPHVCHVTRDRALQPASAAIVFHLPNLHWEVEIV